MEDAPIYMATVSAPTNIAVIKYWGKASSEYNTPINSSISVTLDPTDLRAVTTVAVSRRFTKDRLWLNGGEEDCNNKRFRACIDGCKALASDLVVEGKVVISKEEWADLFIHVSSYNTFPTAAGLASSAAGYAALVAALSELMKCKETFKGELTTIARQGSGSACRSLYGGLVAWRMGSAKDSWKDSKAEQLVDDWPGLKALILVVSDAKKETSSTTGMSTSVATSKLLAHRAEVVVPERMKAMEEAIKTKDFAAFGRITMQDSNQFHATCLDTYPPIFYLDDVSRQIIRMVNIYNEYHNEIRACYTFDAGPNGVLYVLEAHLVELTALALHCFPPPNGKVNQYLNNADLAKKAMAYSVDTTLSNKCPQGQMGDVNKFYATQVGPGPQTLDVKADGTLDPVTGLNTYQPNRTT